MVSFLNGKSPFDEAEEKLEAGETVNGRPKMPSGPVFGWQDGLFLLLVIALIVGGYQYYQYAKQKSAETFARCDALYTAAQEDPAKFAEVEACYDSTWDLGFVSDTMEILREKRVNEIKDMRIAQKDLLEEARELNNAGDKSKAASVLKKSSGAFLLRSSEASEWLKLLAADDLESEDGN